MEIRKYGNMELRKYGSREIWNYGNMENNVQMCSTNIDFP